MALALFRGGNLAQAPQIRASSLSPQNRKEPSISTNVPCISSQRKEPFISSHLEESLPSSQNSPTCLQRDKNSLSLPTGLLRGLICRYVKPYCKDVGFICRESGLFGGDIGFFSLFLYLCISTIVRQLIGLSRGKVGLFLEILPEIFILAKALLS